MSQADLNGHTAVQNVVWQRGRADSGWGEGARPSCGPWANRKVSGAICLRRNVKARNKEDKVSNTAGEMGSMFAPSRTT